MALADAVRSFKQDADLEVCLSKCKIYMPGMQDERAHQLIRACVEANVSGTLAPLCPMLAPKLDVIQVHGLCVVGAPVGAHPIMSRNTCETSAASSARTSKRCAPCQIRSSGSTS